MSQRNCVVEACDRTAYYSREWCRTHFQRWKRTGDVQAHVPVQQKQQRGESCVLGCQAPQVARGWCSMHYNRWRTTGNPGPARRLYNKSDQAAPEKTCTGCGQTKPKAQFNKEPRIGDGRASACKTCSGKKERNRTLLRKYGVTVAEYDALAAAQGGCCRICGNPPPPEQRGLVVDHCHVTGVVRGLLCNNCNALLGMAADDIDRLKAAIRYLERSTEWRNTK